MVDARKFLGTVPSVPNFARLLQYTSDVAYLVDSTVTVSTGHSPSRCLVDTDVPRGFHDQRCSVCPYSSIST